MKKTILMLSMFLFTQLTFAADSLYLAFENRSDSNRDIYFHMSSVGAYVGPIKPGHRFEILPSTLEKYRGRYIKPSISLLSNSYYVMSCAASTIGKGRNHYVGYYYNGWFVNEGNCTLYESN